MRPTAMMVIRNREPSAVMKMPRALRQKMGISGYAQEIFCSPWLKNWYLSKRDLVSRSSLLALVEGLALRFSSGRTGEAVSGRASAGVVRYTIV